MGKRKNVVDTLRHQKATNYLSGNSRDSASVDRGEILPKEDHLNLEDFNTDADARDIDDYLETSKIPYCCSSPMFGDGNCWWRAMADLLGVEGEDAHKILRIQVCENVKRCPEEWKKNIIDLEFKGKLRGLTDFVYRQKKDGQFTDDKGIITQATAYYTGRNIKVFSETGGSVPTVLEGGGEADSNEPLAVFLHGKHFQALVPFQDKQ